MKSLKIAVVACSFFAAAVAHAQNEAPAAGAPQQVAQAAVPQATEARVQHRVAKPEQKNDCVGPVSFCNIYFGS
jgi:Ni/Co efflux regulator RcnB